jgi:polysaccharide export outer membrane protein
MAMTLRKNDSKNCCSLLRRDQLIAAAARRMLPVAIVLLVGSPAFAADDEVTQSGGGRSASVETAVPPQAALRGQAVPASQPEYRLAPGDHIKVSVFDQEQLSGDFVLDGAGKVLLPIIGTVNLSGLTLAEAQQKIQNDLADGVLVKPTVSLRMEEYRPIYVGGDVRKPGSFPFRFGQVVTAAIAAAGGDRISEQPPGMAMADFINADERVRMLETQRLGLLVRKTRLEAERDERPNFVMPQLVGLNSANFDVGPIYAAEQDTFSRLMSTKHEQIDLLEKQRPRIGAEIDAVKDQLDKERRHLKLVTDRLSELETYYQKRIVREDEMNRQRQMQASSQANVASSQAKIARLHGDLGNLDIKLGELKATFDRQILTELEKTLQSLRDADTALVTARAFRRVKAQDIARGGSDSAMTVRITRFHDGKPTTFKATGNTVLEPGDVVEVKLDLPATDGVSTALMRAINPETTATEGSVASQARSTAAVDMNYETSATR